jgi:hypothetical protein
MVMRFPRGPLHSGRLHIARRQLFGAYFGLWRLSKTCILPVNPERAAMTLPDDRQASVECYGASFFHNDTCNIINFCGRYRGKYKSY